MGLGRGGTRIALTLFLVLAALSTGLPILPGLAGIAAAAAAPLGPALPGMTGFMDFMGPFLPPYVEMACIGEYYTECQDIWNCVEALHESDPDLHLWLIATIGFKQDMRLVIPDELPLTTEQAAYAMYGLVVPNPIPVSRTSVDDMAKYYVLTRCNVVKAIRDPFCAQFRDRFGERSSLVVPSCLMPLQFNDAPTGLRPCDTYVSREGTTLCDCMAAAGGDKSMCTGFKSLCSYAVVKQNALTDPGLASAADTAAEAVAAGDDLAFCRDNPLCARSWPDTSAVDEGDLATWAGRTCARELNYFALKTLTLTPTGAEHEDLTARLFGPCTGDKKQDCLANRTWLSGDFLLHSYTSNLYALSKSPLVKCREPALRMIDTQDCGACWSETLSCYENVLGKQVPRSREEQLTSGLVDGLLRQRFGTLHTFMDMGTAAGELGMSLAGWGDPISAADFSSRVFYGAFCISLCRMKGSAAAGDADSGDASADWMRAWGHDDEVADLMVGHSSYNARSGEAAEVYLNLMFGPKFTSLKNGYWVLDPKKVAQCPAYLRAQMALPQPSVDGLSGQTSAGNYPWRVVISRTAWVSCPHNLKLPATGSPDEYFVYDAKDRLCKTGVFKDRTDRCYFSGKKPTGTAWKKGGLLDGAIGLVSGTLFDSYDESAFKPRILQPITVNPGDVRKHVFGVVLNCTGPMDEPVVATYAGAPKVKWIYDVSNDAFRPRHVWQLCKGDACEEIRYVHDLREITTLMDEEEYTLPRRMGLLYDCSRWFDKERGVCLRIEHYGVDELVKPQVTTHLELRGCDRSGIRCDQSDEQRLEHVPLLMFGTVLGRHYPFVRPLEAKEQPLERGPLTHVFDPEMMLDMVYDKEDFPFYRSTGGDQECINLYTGGYSREGTGKLAGHLLGLASDPTNPFGLAGMLASTLDPSTSDLSGYFSRSDVPAGDLLRSVADNLQDSMSTVMRMRGTLDLLGPQSAAFGENLSAEGREMASSLGGARAHNEMVDEGVAEAAQVIGPLVASIVAETAEDVESVTYARLSDALLRTEDGVSLATLDDVYTSVAARLGHDVADGLYELGLKLLAEDPETVLTGIDPPLSPGDRAWIMGTEPDLAMWDARLGADTARQLRHALIRSARDILLSDGLAVLEEYGMSSLHEAMIADAAGDLLRQERLLASSRDMLLRLVVQDNAQDTVHNARYRLGDGSLKELRMLGARNLAVEGEGVLTSAGRRRLVTAADGFGSRELAEALESEPSTVVPRIRVNFGDTVADGIEEMLVATDAATLATRVRSSGLDGLGNTPLAQATIVFAARRLVSQCLASDDPATALSELSDDLVYAGIRRAASLGPDAAGPLTARAVRMTGDDETPDDDIAALREELKDTQTTRMMRMLTEELGPEGFHRLAADPMELEQRMRRLAARRRLEVIIDRLTAGNGLDALVDAFSGPIMTQERLVMLAQSYQRQVFIRAQKLAPEGVPTDDVWANAASLVRTVFTAEVEERYVRDAVRNTQNIISARIARDLDINEQAVKDIVRTRMEVTGATALFAERLGDVVSRVFDNEFYNLPSSYIENANRLAEEIELAARRQAEVMALAGLTGSSDRPNTLAFSKAALIDSLVIARKPQIISGLANPLYIEGSQNAYGVDWTQGFFTYMASLWRIPGSNPPQRFADSFVDRLPDATSKVCRDEGWEHIVVRCTDQATCGPEAVRAGTPEARLPEPPLQILELLRQASRSPAPCRDECAGGNELIYANGTCPSFRHLNRKAHLDYLAVSLANRRKYLERLRTTLEGLADATERRCDACKNALDGLESAYDDCVFALDEDVWDALLRAGQAPPSRDKTPIIGDFLATRQGSELRAGFADELDYVGAVRLCTELCTYWSAQGAIGESYLDGRLKNCPLLTMSSTCAGDTAVPAGNEADAAGVVAEPSGIATCVKDVLAAKESCTLLGMRLFTGKGSRVEGEIEVDDTGSDDPCEAARPLRRLVSFLDDYLPHLESLRGNVTGYLKGARCLDEASLPERGECPSCIDGGTYCNALLDASIHKALAELMTETGFGLPPMDQRMFVTRLTQLVMATAGDLNPSYRRATARSYRAKEDTYLVFDEGTGHGPTEAHPMNVSLWWDVVHEPSAIVRNKVPFTLSPRLDVTAATDRGLDNLCECPGGCFLAQVHPRWAGTRCSDSSDLDTDANFYDDVFPAGTTLHVKQRFENDAFVTDSRVLDNPVDEDADCGELVSNQIFPTSDDYYMGSGDLAGEGNGSPPGNKRLVNALLGQEWRAVLLDGLARDLGLDTAVPCAPACGRVPGTVAEQGAFPRCVRCENGVCDLETNYPFHTAADARQFLINAAYPSSVPMLCSATRNAGDAAADEATDLKDHLRELGALSATWLNRLFPMDPSCYDLRTGERAGAERLLDCQEACLAHKPPEAADELLYGYCRVVVRDESVTGICHCATISDPLGTPVSRPEPSTRDAFPMTCRLPKEAAHYRELAECCVRDHGCSDLISFYNGDPDAFGCACTTGNIALDADQCIGTAEPRLVLEEAYFKVGGSPSRTHAFRGERVRACAVLTNEGGATFRGPIVVEPLDTGGVPAWTRPEGCDRSPSCTLMGSVRLSTAMPAASLALPGGRELEIELAGIDADCTVHLTARLAAEGVVTEVVVPAHADDLCSAATITDEVLVAATVPGTVCDEATALVQTRVQVQTHRGRCAITNNCDGAPPLDLVATRPAGPCAYTAAPLTVHPGENVAVCSAPVAVTETLLGSGQAGELSARISAWHDDRAVLSNLTTRSYLPLRRGLPGVEWLAIGGDLTGDQAFPGSAVGVRTTLANNLDEPFSGVLRLTITDDLGNTLLTETRDVPPIPVWDVVTVSSTTTDIEPEDVGRKLRAGLTLWDAGGVKRYDLTPDHTHPRASVVVAMPRLTVEDAFFREPDGDTRLSTARTCDNVRALVELSNPSPLGFAGRLALSVYHVESNDLLATAVDNAFRLPSGARSAALLTSQELVVPSLGTYLIHVNLTDRNGVRWHEGNVDVADHPSARLRVREDGPSCDLPPSSIQAPAAIDVSCPEGTRTRQLQFSYCTGGGCLVRKNGADGCYLLVLCDGCPEEFVPQVATRPDGSCQLANAPCCEDCRVQVR